MVNNSTIHQYRGAPSIKMLFGNEKRYNNMFMDEGCIEEKVIPGVI